MSKLARVKSPRRVGLVESVESRRIFASWRIATRFHVRTMWPRRIVQWVGGHEAVIFANRRSFPLMRDAHLAHFLTRR